MAAANQLPSNSFTSNAVAVDPGIYSRIRGEASQSARGALINQARQISGVDTSTWMGPLQPINPFVPQGTGYRLIDYPVGVNIRFQPRQEGPIPLISFQELRFCSRNVDLIRIIIENRKQQLQRQNWQFTLKDGSLGEDDPRIAMLNKFFEMPDPLSDIDWSQWLNLIVEEMLVIDAPAVFIHRDKSGKPVALRHVDGACYSDDTEVLTKKGWIRWTEVASDWRQIEFATRSKAGVLEWQHATYYHEADYTGDMLNFRARALDILVSPNHRMLVTPTETSLRDGRSALRGDTIISAERLAERCTRTIGIPMHAEWAGTEVGPRRFPDLAEDRHEERLYTDVRIREMRASGAAFNDISRALGISPMTARRACALYVSRERKRQPKDKLPIEMTGDQFCAFMGAFIAEGSCNLSTNKTVCISQTPQGAGFVAYREMLEEILPGRVRYDGVVNYLINSVALVAYLRQFGHALDKFIPDEIMDASPRQLRIFWHYFHLGDGDSNREGRAFTSSRRLADQLQEIALKIGYSAVIRELQPEDRVIVQGNTQRVVHSSTRYIIAFQASEIVAIRKVDRIPYSGKIYCVSVPNEILYVRRNGKAAWCGNTIKLLVDADGSSPLPPSPFAQQIIKNIPICDLDKTQLFYYPRNLRPDGLYGFSPVEGCINTLNLIMRRDIWRLQFYTSSNQPTGILEAPPNLTNEQVQAFQKMLNASLTGNTDQRWLLHFVPNGTKYTKLEQTPLTDELDQFVAQIICYQFGIPPTPFLMRMGMNRANAESAKDQSKEEGLAPLIAWMSNFVTRLVVAGWGWNDIKFGPIFSHESDPQIQSVVHKTYLSMGVYTINNVLEDLGKDPIGPEGDVNRIYEATGAVPLENVDELSNTTLETAQNGAKAALNPPAPVIAATGTKIPGKANPNAPKGANTQANPPPKTTDGGKSAARAGTSKSPAKMKDSGGTSTKLDFSNVVLRPETIEKLEEKKRPPHFYKVGDLLIPSGLL